MSRLPLRLAATIGAFAALPALAQADIPSVVTGTPVVQSLVQQVMGNLGDAKVLLDKGADPHSFQLRPSQARSLQDADLVFWIGPELTPWLDRAIDTLNNSTAISLLHADGTIRQDFHTPELVEDEDGHDHDHEAHADSDHDHEDHDDGHDHEDHDEHHHHDGLDPHAWLNPQNAEIWLQVIAKALAEKDPEHADTYAANADAAIARIKDLDAGLAKQLAPAQGKPFVVFHAAYGYLADHYGLEIAGSVSAGDAAAPGAAHLEDLHQALGADHVICAFPEAQHNPKQIKILLEGTEVKLGGALDPSGSTLDYGPDLYATLLSGLTKTLSDCLTQD
ncbi:zinc ABC transporter substrate-binding protein (plasmid) [Thioclava litoralis]|uniref:High-affinity zinc uptake system protein ZnuA n=1 Tax=Thioclava litoralis TaxID=3076557 RepID=A0ABZ1E4N5_9RHOB|nr:zinc ABC transporter substrate-binding protein [Thioclava sp. FTW29]